MLTLKEVKFDLNGANFCYQVSKSGRLRGFIQIGGAWREFPNLDAYPTALEHAKFWLEPYQGAAHA